MTHSQILKKDLFGEVRRVSAEDGDTIVRDAAPARPWLAWVARALLRREARILALLSGESGFPQILACTDTRLVRSFVHGQPMQEARPCDPMYFRHAAQLLRRMHRLGVVHNDLAKEPNLLVDTDGEPVFVDFQLAWSPRRRGRLWRTLAREDLRHLLKHKRTYCPDLLSSRELQILDHPSWPSRIWMKTGKPLYVFVTRRLLGWADREGAADRGRMN